MEPTTCQEAEPFALQVMDDSMAPEFAEGCIIIVDPTGVASEGAFVFAEREDGFILRQLELREGKVFLRPLNDAYPTEELPGGLAAVKGVVTQRAGRRRRDRKRY